MHRDRAGRIAEGIVEHQGFGWIDVIVHGVAAHGSAPEKGIDAIVHMAEVVRRLIARPRGLRAERRSAERQDRVPHGTLQAGTTTRRIRRARCSASRSERSRASTSDRVREIETIFAELSKEARPDFRGEVDVKLDREPFLAEGHEEFLAALDAAASDVIGRPFEQQGLNAWTDAALMQAAGIPTVLIGSAGGNFHAPDEWASISSSPSSPTSLRGPSGRFCGDQGK